MSNCNYNQAQDILTWIYGELKPAVAPIPANLIKFDQKPFKTAKDSLNDLGYVYVPTACQNKELCKVVIAFHGCEMTLADIKTAFVANTGLNQFAESNNFIVLYPQAKKSLLNPNNPKGCFDWWGYTSPITPIINSLKYATKQGKQMNSVWGMLNTLAGKKFEKIYPDYTIED